MEQILGKEAHSPRAARQSSFRQQSSATRGGEQEVGTPADRAPAHASLQSQPRGNPLFEIFCSWKAAAPVLYSAPLGRSVHDVKEHVAFTYVACSV